MSNSHKEIVGYTSFILNLDHIHALCINFNTQYSYCAEYSKILHYHML